MPFHEQFLTFFEFGLHFLKVGLLGSGLGAVEELRKFKTEFILVFVSFMHLSMLCPRGGPRDRVGTLIRNKNLESNFLTLGIRFQFKVPHLGEGLACIASIPVRF